MKKVMAIIPVAMLLFAACSRTGMETQAPPKTNASLAKSTGTTVQSDSTGNASAIPAFYDSMLLKIHFVEFSSTAEASLIANNKSINFIYRSDNGLPNNQPFISVIDAIPGDHFNPLWREVQIVFHHGCIPHQLFSDNAVLAAASGVHPEIMLDTTNEVYWCPVVGQK